MKFRLPGIVMCLAMALTGSFGLPNLSTPAFTMPSLSQQTEIFEAPVNNFSSTSTPVWYYTPAGILLSSTAEIVLNNRTTNAIHSVTVQIRLWDSEYIQHIQSFVSRKTKRAEVELLPIPFKWVRLEYHPESDYVKPVKSQWRSLRNFPQTIPLRIPCASLEICERSKKRLQADSPTDEANVQLFFAFDNIPSSRTVSVCLDGHQIHHTPTFNLIAEHLPGYEKVYLRFADYYTILHELISETIESVTETHEFIDDQQIDRIVMKLLPRFRYNLTSTAVFTEEMWRATYWTASNERPQRTDHLQELFGNGMELIQESMRDDDVTGALGAFGHCQSVVQAFAELRSGKIGAQWDRKKNITGPVMLYCVDINTLNERKICNLTVLLSKGRADYVMDAIPAPTAAVSDIAALSPSVDKTDALRFVRYLSEPKGSATWLVRDADTLWSVNSTALTITIRNKENATCHHVSIMTNSFGELSVSLPLSVGYSLTFELVGYHAIVLWTSELNLVPGMAFMEPLLFINKRFTGSGTASGTVYSVPSLTYPNPRYGPLADADVTFLSLDRKTLEAITATTTAAGSWKVDLPTGLYSLAISKTGYITAASTIAVLGGKEKPYDSCVTTAMNGSSVRIVLCGDARIGFDLDLHVRGPTEGNTSRFHVNPRDRQSSDNLMFQEVEIGGKPYASTIVKRQLAGAYRVSVYDWTNKIPNSWVLANSKATLQIYRGSGLWATYFVPNRMGNMWHAVEINGLNLTAINVMGTIVETTDGQPSFDAD